jgi:CRISPR-associated protein Cas2
MVVVSYDIADEKRRRKIADTLENFGVRVQASVFECFIDADSFSRLRREVAELILPDDDSVHYYPICAKDRAVVQILANKDFGPSSGYVLV